jgi:hypothetical protein
MQLDERQRKMVRLAFKCRDADLRRTAVQRILAAARPVESLSVRETKSQLGPIERRLVRMAFVSHDPVLRRGIIESIRIAKYSEKFMQAVEGQEFHNPDTGNKVKFVSLPHPEQQKIYEQWAQQQEAGGGAESQQAGPSAEVRDGVRAHLGTYFPQAVSSLAEAKKLHAAGKPWRMTAVAPGAAGGQKFWEARGDGDKIELRFGPVGKWVQAKPMESVEAAWKRFQSKLNKEYEHADDEVAMRVSTGPAGLDADSVWKALEAKHGKDPKQMAEAVSAAVEALGSLGYYKWDAVAQTVEGLQSRLQETQAKAKAEKPKEKPKKTEAPKPEKTEAPTEIEAPTAPTGKHKDRKELRAKPKAKMSDAVEITTELTDLVLPEGMDPKRREQAKAQLAEASYQLLAQLRDNAAQAVKEPKGKYMKALLSSGYTEEGVAKMHAALTKTLVAAEGKKYHPDVLKVANQYDLEAEDADEVRDFKADKPSRGKKLTPQELFTKFMAKAKPETKKRMQGMDIGDFMAMYNAIMAEEEEGEIAVKTASRLPHRRHDEIQKAIQEGRVAGPDDENLTIFDPPTKTKKKALSAEDRAIVRLAHASQDRAVRRELLALLSF